MCNSLSLSLKTKPTLIILFPLISFVFLATLAGNTAAQSDTTTPSQENIVTTTSNLENIGEYSFVAQVEQTLIPRPIPLNIGATEERIDSQLTAEVRPPDYTKYTWQFEADADIPPIIMEQDGQNFYLLNGDEKTAIENPLTGFTPSSDFSTYLRASQNVRVSDTTHPDYTIYDFDINGASLAELMIAEVRRQLSPEQLATFNPDTSHIENITGQGQIFIDQNGLPQRQILNLNMPEVNERYDSLTTFTIDYQYSADVIDTLSGTTPASSPSFLTEATTQLTDNAIVETAVQASPIDWLTLFTTILAALGITITLIRANRKIRFAIPFLLTAVLFLTPILQPAAYAHQQRVAQANAPISLTKALGLDSDETVKAETEAAVAATMEIQTAQETLDSCGTGDSAVDSDLDGLNDFVERCLGTNPYNFDTDNDGLTDTLEINGFVFTDTVNITHTIYTNPHEADSNNDGLIDSVEWLDPGFALEIDQDGDNLPNPWDPDNDGDLVPDAQDLDPFAVTDYQSSFSLVTTRDGDNFNGFQYIDIQVQPQDLDHLRLSTTALDWPYDEQGTLQARDHTNLGELTFAPQLKITTNNAPLPYLQTQYGISVFERNGRYEMIVPLYPVGDGGQMTSFSTRVVYASSELSNINWSDIELVWTAFMDTSINDGARTQNVPVAEFTEPSFRITGLNITKNTAQDMAVIGTPAQQTDHRLLANTVLGLSGAFLENSSFDFDSLVARLNNASATITETWGVPINDLAIANVTAPHPDQAFTGLYSISQLADNFLKANSYSTSDLASFIIATENGSGSESLYSITDLSSADLSFSLANIPMQTARGLILTHYQYDTDSWIPADLLTVLPDLLDYYDDATIETIQTELAQSYPLLTTEDLATVLTAFYLTWGFGILSPISYDAISLIEQDATDEAIADIFYLPTKSNLLTYLVESLDVAIQGEGSVLATPEGLYQQIEIDRTKMGTRAVSSSFWTMMEGSNLIIKTTERFGVRSTLGLAWKAIVRNVRTRIVQHVYQKQIQKLVDQFSDKTDAVNRAKRLIARNQAQAAAQAATQGPKQISKWAARWKSFVKFFKIFTKVATVIVQVAAIGFTLYTIWKTYADFNSPYSYERDFALGVAIISTVIEVAYAAIALVAVLAAAFIGLAASVAGSVFGLVYLIIELIGIIVRAIFPNAEIGDSLTATVFAKIFVGDVHLRTELRDTNFDGTEVSFNGNGFGLAGSTLTVSDRYTGQIEGFQYRDRLEQANTFAYYRASAGANIDVSTADTRFDPYRCRYSGSKKYCSNDLFARYTFQNAGLNQKITFKYIIEADLEYTNYIFGGIRKVDKSENILLPDELDEADQWEAAVLYIDILPATLDELLAWNTLTNHDVDADGVIDTTENDQALTLALSDSDIDSDGKIETLDWDSDGDGLSDGFEQSTANSLHALWYTADSDSDGLDDNKEYELDLQANLPDSDSDGLLDGAEVYQWDGTSWNGGGWMVDILGTSYWTFTDPNNADRDGDGVSDKSEQANGTSPYGYNTAPTLALTAGPNIDADNIGVYVRNGDTLSATLTLDNVGTSPISDTLELCFPTAVTNLSVETGGDRQPTTQAVGNCRQWDFSSNPLQLFQTFFVTMTGQATASTITDTITTTVTYDLDGVDTVLAQQVAYNQDNTAPTIFISDPLPNTILTSQYYVIGGNALDTDSYIDRVEVTVDNGTHQATLTDADWGYTWQLPTDGDVTITAVAYDIVGNASTADSVQVTVDTEAPQFTINLAENATISANETLSTTFPLSGTITDNRAGIDRVQLRYNEGNWRTIWNDGGAPLSANWNGVWEIPTVATAQGKHNLELRAYDIYGNVGTLTRTVFIDVLPPTNELSNRAFIQTTPRHVPAGPLDILGVASDAGNNPLPADPADLTGSLNSIEDATVWLQVDSLDDNDAGATINWIGDINGDRLGDLAVGLPAANGGTGRVVVVKGAPGGWPVPNIGDLEFLGDNSPSYVGSTGAAIGDIIKPAGDVNGNGVDDFLIADPNKNQINLILGIPSLEAADNPLDGSGSSELLLQLIGNGSGESFDRLSHHQIAPAGDINNDGLADILVSASGFTSTVYLIAGEAPFPQTYPIDGRAAFTLATDSAGSSVAGVGDVTNDGIDDFAIAFSNTVYLFAGGGGWVTGGLTELTTADAIATFATTDGLTTITPAGDLNGDSVADFAYSNGSTPVVVFGDTLTTQTLSGFPAALSGFLSGVGDVDQDGRADLLIGNADDNAYLISGSDLSSVAATIDGVASAASTPLNPAGADLAGDGSPDLALVPTAAVASALGYDGFGSVSDTPFIPRNALPTSNPIVTPVTITPDQTLLPGDVTVAVSGGDYNSIQAAIDSGASRVLIQPGIYEEAITLASGITLIGSGADRTILRPPTTITNTPFITASAINNGSISNLTLLGSGGQTALAVSNGATDIELSRSVVQGFATAVTVDGASSTLALSNNTIVGNTAGFLATNNAGVNIRNTIFAYNSGTAVQYDASPALDFHQYNLYFANGTDQAPNNPGGGELFSDPLFLDYANGDFRTEPFSPVIDAGSPGDSVPPGAGSAADIGHLEQGAFGFFVDTAYCSSCANDGLIWGVNAFNLIQDGIDAALADLDVIELTTPISFTVGVNEGVYTETVVISGSVNLIGRSPDTTAILGNGGPAVTFNAAVDAAVSGFTLLGGGTTKVGVLLEGGSNTVHVAYNLIKHNTTGISVTERATGQATFNTIISNTTGIEVARGAIFNTNADSSRTLADSCYSAILCEERGFVWLDTAQNIVSYNTNGMVAHGQSVIFSDNNLLFNTVDYTNVITGLNDISGQDPLLTGENGYLTVSSPAVDAVLAKIDPPLGGGLVADLGWHELRAAPLSVFMGQGGRSVATENIGVGQVEYAVVEVVTPTLAITETLPSVWQTAVLDNPGEKLTYWRATVNATNDGALYRVYSRATDLLGNTETDLNDWFDGAFYVDGSAPQLTFNISTTPYNSTFNFPTTWRLLELQVSDYISTSFDIADVYFIVNGERVEGDWRVDGWTADGTTPRTFIYLLRNTTGSNQNYTVEAVAVDGAGNRASDTQSVFVSGGASNATNVDIYPPTYVTITSPIAGQFVADALTIDIEALDSAGYDCQFATPMCASADSGIQGVEVSFDGGRSWSAATYIGLDSNSINSIYQHTGWTPPADLDATTIPVRVRATDYFGLSTTSIVTITVDTAGPRLIGDYTYSLPIGTYLEYPNSNEVSVTLPPVVDGSGYTTRVSFTYDDEGLPLDLTVHSGDTLTRYPSERISAVFPMGVVDESMNFSGRLIGSWHGAGNFVQSVKMDGNLDLEFGEWLTPTERLDDDFRNGRTQTLWATWDFEGPFIGFEGGSWGPDGQLWAYFDVYAGQGTTQPISGTATLPFSADVAFQAIDESTGYVWQYNDGLGQWLRKASPMSNQPPIGDFDFREYGHDGSTGITEMHTYNDADVFGYSALGLDTHRMMVYSLDNDLNVSSAFPTANTLDGMFQHFYEWANVQNDLDLLTLPTAAQQPAVELFLTADPETGGLVTSDDTMTYVAYLTSIESDPVTGLQLVITGTTGLTFQNVVGAAAFDCSAGTSCVITAPTIPAGSTVFVTATATTDSDLTGITGITTTAELQADLTLPASQVVLYHEVDITPPTVIIGANSGNAYGVGPQQVVGRVDDDGGVSSVEVSVDGINWTPAEGVFFWKATIDAPDLATWTLYARATDYVGQVSDIVTVSAVRDTTPPEISVSTIPTIVGSSSYRFTGTINDFVPTDARAGYVQVQFDDPNSEWIDTQAVPTDFDDLFWYYRWGLPAADGITHTVRFRGFDQSGNVTTTLFTEFVVDNIAPQLTHDTDLSTFSLENDTLSGTVSDGRAVDRMFINIYPSSGNGISDVITPTLDGTWQYEFNQPVGEYTVYIFANDGINGDTRIGPITVINRAAPQITPQAPAGNNLVFDFASSGSCSTYNLHRSASPYFTPEVGTIYTADPTPPQITLSNELDMTAGFYFYLVAATGCPDGADGNSEQQGVFTFELNP